MNENNLLFQAELILRILIAAICGSLVGYERSNRNKEAGIRTHSIISLGSALFMVISKYGFNDVVGVDASRVAAQIVSGIGFIGAGVIFVKHGTVSGLTTAAGMWATSGIGMCIGAGMYEIGIVSSVLIIGIQTILHKNFIMSKVQTAVTLYLEVEMKTGVMRDIKQTLKDADITVYEMKIEKSERETSLMELECNISQQSNKDDFMEVVSRKSYFRRISFS